MPDMDPRETVQNISDDIKALVEAEIALAKAELMPKAKSAGLGAGLFGAAGYLAICAASLLYVAASLGVGILLSSSVGTLPGIALGFVIVAVFMIAIAGVMVLIGKRKLEELKDITPEMTIANAQGVATDVQGAIARGKDEAPSSVFQRSIGA